MNLRNLFVNVALWKQLLRYGIVGGSVAIVYVALTSLIIETTAWSALKASITGFVLTIPFAYSAHRFVTLVWTRRSNQLLRPIRSRIVYPVLTDE